MAMDLQDKPRVSFKHEQFVEQQLGRVSRRIHAVEVGKALLLLAVATLTYALTAALFDLSVGKDAGAWAVGVRLAGLVTYLAVAAALGGLVLWRLSRRINPYYAARQIEDNVADAKNSVVNWLDLKQTKLPPIIRSALGSRAARDIKATDPEKAVDVRGTWLLGGILGGLFLCLAILFLTGPNRFGSLMRRAFLPLGDSALISRTEIELLQPKDGDATVALQQKVDFRARITGTLPRVNTPHAPKVHYRYNEDDSWAAVALEEDTDGTWFASLQADQVQNGFWYKLTAGDAETAIHQVKLRGMPQANRFEIAYQYRAYAGVRDFRIEYPNNREVFPRIKALQGTTVTLLVRTNRAVLEGKIELELGGVRKDLLGEVDADDPQAFRVKFMLDKKGQFRVRFTSRDGEENVDRSPYPIEIWPDSVPNVVLHKPGKDVSLAANGTLPLEGIASDDYGLKELTLRMNLVRGPTKLPLEAKLYRPGKSLQFPDGSYPDRLEYLDFIALEQVKNDKGQPFSFAVGMVLEYWLEARDNSDYPEKLGNVGKSAAYKINILVPEDQKKAQDDRKKADQDQKTHDKKQDKDLKKQQDAKNDKNPDGSPKSDEQKKIEEKTKQIEDAIKDAEKTKQEEEQKKKGEAKGSDKDRPKSAEKSEGEQPPKLDDKNKKDKQPSPEQAGEKKDNGQKNADPMKPDQKAGASKDDGKGDKKPQPDSGKARGSGDSKPPENNAKGADPKEGPKENQPDKAAAKPGDKSAPPKDKGPGTEPNQGEAKSDGSDQSPAGTEQSPRPGQARGPEQSPQKSASKDGGNTRPRETPPSAGAHDDKQGPIASEPKKPADPKLPQKPGEPRDDSPLENPRAEKDPTPEDIKRLKDKIKTEGPMGKDAARELEQIARDAKDPNVREAAKDALKGSGRQSSGQEPSARDNSGRGADDDLKANDPNADFARRGGNLALEDLKQKVTPDVLKKAGITDKEWQQFLKDRQAYDQTLRQQRAKAAKADPLTLRGDPSQLANKGPSLVESKNQAVSPTQMIRGEPPPEFRDKYIIWTNRQQGPEKK